MNSGYLVPDCFINDLHESIYYGPDEAGRRRLWRGRQEHWYWRAAMLLRRIRRVEPYRQSNRYFYRHGKIVA